jgi:hypothetical protein
MLPVLSIHRIELLHRNGPTWVKAVVGQNPEWLECAGSVGSTPRTRLHFGIAANSPYVPGADLSRCSKLRVQNLNLFDHLVGAREQRGRNREAERFGGLEVDVQHDFGCLLDRQFGRLVALENPAGIDSGQAVRVGGIGAIAHQPTSRDKLVGYAPTRWDAVAGRQRRNLTRPAYEESVWSDDERSSLQLAKLGKGRLNVADGTGLQEFNSNSE